MAVQIHLQPASELATHPHDSAITPPSTPPRPPAGSRACKLGGDDGLAGVVGAGAVGARVTGAAAAAGPRINMAPKRIGSSQSSPTRSSPRKPPPTQNLPTSTSNLFSLSTLPQDASTANIASTSGGSGASASTSSITTLPTPLSISPSLSHLSSTTKLPPAFADSHPRTHARYPSSHTPFSPYRPGEYGRSERGIASERTKIRKVERRLFDDGSSTQYSGERGTGKDAKDGIDEAGVGNGKEDELVVPKLNAAGGKDVQGSSPLAPAFEAKMVLRNGASVDLISWLRTNFHHIHPAQHNSMTPQMSLIGIRALLLERFPRVPDLTELSKAVIAAFPHSRWEVSKGAFSAAEPPTVRGLVWHGKDVADEDDEEEEEREREREREQRDRERERRERERARLRPGIVTRARAASGMVPVLENGEDTGSRSPPQSTLVSPISSSRRAVPDTPARSVLEEFAEIATLADKTPASGVKELPDEEDDIEGHGDMTLTSVGPSPAYALATICNSFDRDDAACGGAVPNPRKRRAETPPARRRSSTPDKLHGLLAAAEAVEGSPITSVLAHNVHKRRRTIGGAVGMRDIMDAPTGNWGKKKVSSGGGRKGQVHVNGQGLSAPFGFRQTLEEKMDMDEADGPASANNEAGIVRDLLVPLNDTASAMSLTDLETASLSAQSRPARAHTSSTASQTSVASGLSVASAALGLTTAPSQGLGSADSSFANGANPHGQHAMGVYDPVTNGASSSTATAAAPTQPRPSTSRRPNELPTQGDHPGVDCKPPYPYHELIRHAIDQAPDRRLQLNQIYASISERFPFFKTLDEKKTAGWQNSIRHNLSLKKMFVRVNKVDGVPDDNNGKGGWWTVQDGIPDEGRPGRKGKGKKGRGSAEGVESVLGVGDGDAEGSDAAGQGGAERADSADRVDRAAAYAEGVNGTVDGQTAQEFTWPPAVPVSTAGVGQETQTISGYGWEKAGVMENGQTDGPAYLAQLGLARGP